MHSSMAKTSKERKILVYGRGKDHHKIIEFQETSWHIVLLYDDASA